MSPVGRLVFKTSEALNRCLVGSTPTSSAITPYIWLFQRGCYKKLPFTYSLKIRLRLVRKFSSLLDVHLTFYKAC